MYIELYYFNPHHYHLLQKVNNILQLLTFHVCYTDLELWLFLLCQSLDRTFIVVLMVTIWNLIVTLISRTLRRSVLYVILNFISCPCLILINQFDVSHYHYRTSYLKFSSSRNSLCIIFLQPSLNYVKYMLTTDQFRMTTGNLDILN